MFEKLDNMSIEEFMESLRGKYPFPKSYSECSLFVKLWRKLRCNRKGHKYFGDKCIYCDSLCLE